MINHIHRLLKFCIFSVASDRDEELKQWHDQYTDLANSELYLEQHPSVCDRGSWN